MVALLSYVMAEYTYRSSELSGCVLHSIYNKCAALFNSERCMRIGR